MLDSKRKRALRALRTKELSHAAEHLRQSEHAVLELEASLERIAMEVQRVDDGMGAPLISSLTAARLEMMRLFDAQEWARRTALVEQSEMIVRAVRSAHGELSEARSAVDSAHKRLKALS